ncbi:MAG: lactate utilization protein C, partial [Desulfamplus sp.]
LEKYSSLETICQENGISLIKNNLRKYTSGIDMGITFADYGIAETGTIVVNSDSEDKRLSTMISEIHAALLYKSDIRPNAVDMADELAELTSKPSSYTAFITGPSRTADIERVLAIGVHGPLELHIILL